MRVSNRKPKLAVGLALLAVAVAACRSEPPQPIRVQPTRLIIQNQTASPWSQVEVWLNDHYRVTAPRLEAGQQLVIPLDVFVAGFGQRFDARKQVVQGIEVTARSGDGRPVKLVWGRGRRR